jgi:hypothetical protein
MEWLQYILAQDSIPQTFTTSYGDDEQSVPREYAESVCTMFAQLGARGSSIMFSSGDFGVGMSDCKTNDGTNRTIFQPMFPASCECLVPFNLLNRCWSWPRSLCDGCRRDHWDQSWERDIFLWWRILQLFLHSPLSKPHSQKVLGSLREQVLWVVQVSRLLFLSHSEWLILYLLFSASGRAYPDVSAQSAEFNIIFNSIVTSVAGTSASTPVRFHVDIFLPVDIHNFC